MSQPRGPPGLGDTLLPILLVPVAYVCSSLLPEGYVSVVVRLSHPPPAPKVGCGATLTVTHTDGLRHGGGY